ncbi:MAG: hypothetical protein GX020_06450 [Firmicutes bacterium]|nr:hypothetical protein [Bacillota bacterium]
MNFLIDTNIFDELIADELFPDIFLDAGRIFNFYSTPIQEKEIEQLQDERKKKLIQSITRTVIPALDLPERFYHGDAKHLNDYQIAWTAYVNKKIAALITNDKNLITWCKDNDLGIVWTYQQFITWYLNESGTPKGI